MEKLSLRSAEVSNEERGHNVCSITRAESDKVRLIGFHQTFLAPFRIALQTSWEKGIQEEGIYGCAYEFKLRGKPWIDWRETDVLSCRLIIGILRFMLSHGWVLQVDLTPSAHSSCNLDSWFFRKGVAEKMAQMCAIGFKWDKIRIIDANPQVKETVELAIRNFWHLGLQEICLTKGYDVEFKLKGHPWQASSKERTYMDAFVMHLMEELRCIGWNLYVATDNACYSQSSDTPPPVKCWILKKSRPSVDPEHTH